MTQTAHPLLVKLPPILDLRAAKPLASQLLALRGAPVALDASGVERLGGLCLQILLAAQTTWREDDVRLCLTDPSQPFLESAACFGALGDAEARFS